MEYFTINHLAEFTILSFTQFLLFVGFVFVAGVVRGFSGFALSAITMAGLAFFIPPIELIPVCFLLEAAASIIMFKGGIKDANMKIVWGLAIGSAIGVPIGLLATTTLPIETSKMIALILIVVLALAQLLKVSPKFLATKPGLYVSGLVAGIATGLASIGGMIVALYVLAQDSKARTMRGSLVMFLFISMFTSLIYLTLYGVMNKLAIIRGLTFIPICMIGVWIGTSMFRPSLESFYKKFCLVLLISLASISLAKTMF